jgi:hypothetical protein
MMKKKVLISAVTSCFFALVAVATAYAQFPGTAIRATIPFDFSVRGKTLPAGKYEIKRITDSPDGLVIRNVNDQHDYAMFETESVEPRKIPNSCEIVFHRYGDSYFLSELLTAGEETGRELAPSRAERQLRREMASTKTEPESVALAAF